MRATHQFRSRRRQPCVRRTGLVRFGPDPTELVSWCACDARIARRRHEIMRATHGESRERATAGRHGRGTGCGRRSSLRGALDDLDPVHHVGRLGRGDERVEPPGSIAFGSGTRHPDDDQRLADPGSSPPGSTDHPVAPFSTISTVPPVSISTWPASPAAVPRSRYSSTARATIARRRASSQLSSSAIPTQPASQARKSSGASARVEVRVEVVDRARRPAPARVEARRASAATKSSSWYSAGSAGPSGCGRRRAPGRSRASGALDQDLVLVGEHERVGLELEALGLLAALAGHRVRPEQPDVLDQLGPADALEYGVDLARR